MTLELGIRARNFVLTHYEVFYIDTTFYINGEDDQDECVFDCYIILPILI